MKTEREKMLAGELYNAGDAELCAARARARRLCRAFNTTPEEDGETRDALLRELLGSAGQDIYVESDFKCDYGCNIHVGENFYANFDVVILDCCEVHIGKNCMLALRVCIYTATHPLDPYERNEIGLEYGKPVTIGDNVWIGGSAVTNPGVTIGDNAVIASGSVVTKSVPAHTVVGGNPAHVLRVLEQKI